MMSRLSALPVLLLLAVASADANPAERTAIWEWRDVERVVAVGDLHGGYAKLVQLLQSSGLVDDYLTWTGGETHLVAAGDLLDRGAREREVLDLLRRLQGESEAAGGRVHVLLGNHESMTLTRDVRYVHPDAYRTYLAEETQKDRRAAWKGFLSTGMSSDLSDPRIVFNTRFPRGYFGRLKVFNRDGEYGSWLLKRPAVVKINDIVYTHGGLTEEFAGLGVDGINRQVLDQLNRYLEQREILEEVGLLTPAMSFQELLAAVEKALKRRRSPKGEARDAAEALLISSASPILGSRGPLWYRGSSFEDERIERDMIERSLELIGARAMVVAHSYTGGNRITSRFHGTVYRLDHGILESPRPLALLVEQDEVLVLDSSNRHTSRPIPELPSGLVSKPPKLSEISYDELEDFLSSAPVTESRDLGRGSTRPRLMVLERNGLERRGIFKTIDQGEPVDGEASDRYHHEVAAYRLSRRLGLDMVPVTVVREIDSRTGSLQWWVEGAVDHQAAEAYDLELYQTEVTARRLANGKVFDFLIGNPERELSDVLCLVNGEQVFLIDHSEAFAASSELSMDDLVATPGLVAALDKLDRAALTADLEGLLTERQIEAVLARRDVILGHDGASAAAVD